MMKKEIKKILQKVVGKDAPDFLVEVPKEKNHGDYSSNIALVLSKQLGKNPRTLAQEIVTKLGAPDGIEKIEVAGAGFINFFISKKEVVDALKKIDENVGKIKKPFLGKEKVVIEFTDPNPFKEFHIGHLMTNAIGESLARLVDFSGKEVKRANYQGDVGLHVAKAIWGKVQKPNSSWGGAYVFGSAEYENNKEAINAINKKVYDRTDKNINALYDAGRKESLDYFETIYKKLGTKFDYYFFESEVAEAGKKLVMENVGKIFEKGENGAIIFPGEKYGLHTRVFVNAEGLPTYEAKELALAREKYGRYKYDKSLIITANEITEYFKVLLSAMSQVYPELAKKTKHFGHGMMKLPEGKMSSRTGKVVTAESMIEKVKEMVLQKAGDKKLDEETVEKIAISAIKYSILRQSIGSDIIYDFEKAISFEGDSGPYLQYSYVRAKSILEKATRENIKPSFAKPDATVGSLEKLMIRFGEVVAQASENYAPHEVAIYLTELAREFNAYYATHKIVDAGDQQSSYRVALAQVFSQVMKNGLWLLGISAPEKM